MGCLRSFSAIRCAAGSVWLEPGAAAKIGPMPPVRLGFASRFLLHALLAAALGSASAVAQTTTRPLGRERPEVLSRWQQTLTESDAALKAGHWKSVHETADRLLAEMVGRIEGGVSAAPYLASAVVQRGIAQAGLGNLRDALWDLEMAAALHPVAGELELAAYGEAGARLTRYRDERGDPWAGYATEVGEPPRKVRAPSPRYPRAKRIACLEEAILIRSIIDIDGTLQSPTLLSPDFPVLGFAAMDRLRDWRFKPARLDGRPVAVIHSLLVDYNITLCRNLAAFHSRMRGDGNE